MIYVSIDLETTGLETENHQVLSIGAVIEDTTKPEIAVEDLPTFHGIIAHNELAGSPFALNMNRDLIEKISVWQNTKAEARKEVEKMTGMSFFMENEIVEGLFQFFYRNGIGPEYKEPGDHLKGAVKRGEDGIMYPALTSNMPKVHFTAAGKNFATFVKGCSINHRLRPDTAKRNLSCAKCILLWIKVVDHECTLASK
jgi:hypothetical protein